jgi:hypothetical protein
MSRWITPLKIAFRSPTVGLASSVQAMAISTGGKMFGTIAVSSKTRRSGALVRTVIQASATAKASESSEAPAAKTNESTSSR